MKKTVTLLLIFSLVLALTACGGDKAADTRPEREERPAVEPTPGSPTAEPAPESPAAAASTAAPAGESAPDSPEGIDLDLTRMSGMMAYAEISSILYHPSDYAGQILRMRGTAMSYPDPQTGVTYNAVVIQDATACCAVGFDLILAEGQSDPQDGESITVTGELEPFEVYEGIVFIRLTNARIDAP